MYIFLSSLNSFLFGIFLYFKLIYVMLRVLPPAIFQLNSMLLPMQCSSFLTHLISIHSYFELSFPVNYLITHYGCCLEYCCSWKLSGCCSFSNLSKIIINSVYLFLTFIYYHLKIFFFPSFVSILNAIFLDFV